MSKSSAVSIRARHCWRAMRCSPWCWQAEKGFNPRPPLLAGDAGGAFWQRRIDNVSIRARHCWRAMPTPRHPSRGRWTVSIRARHCWRAMQSSATCVMFVAYRFNPRPPLLAGDAFDGIS